MHKKRKRFTALELARYFGVHRNTIAKVLQSRHIDLRDANAVLDFVRDYGLELARSRLHAELVAQQN